MIKHNIAQNIEYYGYQSGLPSMVHKFFDKKKFSGTGKNENISKKELPEELHKPFIRKFNKIIHSPFIDNICGADLVDMQLVIMCSSHI